MPPTKITPVINLAAKMNTRSNNEVLDVDPNTAGLELSNISNGDLFYTKAITSRQGCIDIGGGVLNASSIPSTLYDFTLSGVAGSGVISYDFVGLAPEIGTFAGMIINATSGSIYTGKVYLRGTAPDLTNLDIGRDLKLNMWVSLVNALPSTTSGVGGIQSQVFPSPLDKIALTGFYYDAANPLQLKYPLTSSSVPSYCKPEAISLPTVFNLGTYSGVAPGVYKSDLKEVDFQFYAPFPLSKTLVYYMKMVVDFASGVENPAGTNLSLETEYITNTGVDFNYNMVSAQEGNFNTLLANSFYLSGFRTPKLYLDSQVKQYPEPSYAIVDYPNSNFVWSIPAKNGTKSFTQTAQGNLTWLQTPNNQNITWNGLVNTPAPGTTNVVEFGNLMTIPSGNHTIQGAYCYLGIISGNGWSPFTINKTVYPIGGYNVGYVVELCTFTTGLNTFAGSKFKGSVIASYTGNHIFNNPYTYTAPTNVSATSLFDPATGSTQTQLDKVYGMFENPVTLNLLSGTQYLLNFRMLDSNTGGQNTDYITKVQSVGSFNTQYYNTFGTPLLIGMNNLPANTNDYFLYNQIDDNSTYYGWNPGSNLYQKTQLSCGLISVQSGNAITSIYDYRIGDERTQEIIFTQRDKVQSFKDFDPQDTIITLWSGAPVDNNYKWSHSTFQSVLFSHQYSKSPGVCWDQIYFNPSGQSMQYHGLQPTAQISGFLLNSLPAGAAGITPSSSFNIILATTMDTGGFRSSPLIQYSGVFDSGRYLGNGNAMQIVGAFTGVKAPFDIQYSGINNGTYQYNFDVNSLGTYVFATQPSGSVYFLAPLCDSAGGALSNPRPNYNTWNMRNAPGAASGVFLYDITFTNANSIQVPQAINNDQTYVLNQIPVPQFKKTIVYKNILFGIGDVNNPSRLWYSEQQGPQIFGIDTNFYGFYDIDNDNGQELTGMGIFKDYLLIFKENSMYKATYNANPGDPLDIAQVSNTKGCLGIFTTVDTDFGVVGLNQYGPFLASYSSIDSVGDEILPTFQQFDRTELIFSEAVHDPSRQQVYWSISSANESLDNQIGLVYSYAERAWGLRQNSMWNAAARIGDTDNFSKYYIGDTIGQIQQMNVPGVNQDILFVDTNGQEMTQNITLTFETPWLNFGNSQNLKQLKFVKINCNTSNQKLRVDVYTDQNSTTKRYTRYLNMNAPVINRVCSLAGLCRTVKLVMTTVGQPDQVKINSIQFGYLDQGLSSNIS